MGQVDHHAQLLMADIELGQCCLFVIALLRLGDQVVHIQKCQAYGLGQCVFVAVWEMGQIAL